MSFYSDLADDANQLLSEFAQGTMVLKKIYNNAASSTPWDTSSPQTVEYVFNGIAEDIKATMVNGSLIQTGDKMVTLNVRDDEVKPDQGDILVIDGVEFNIVSATQEPAAGIAVINQVVVRR